MMRLLREYKFLFTVIAGIVSFAVGYTTLKIQTQHNTIDITELQEVDEKLQDNVSEIKQMMAGLETHMDGVSGKVETMYDLIFQLWGNE